MNSFAMLEKSASQFPVNPNSGLRDPFPAYQPQTQQMYQQPGQAAPQAPSGPQESNWGEIENPWGDLGVSMIPGVGSVYMGNKAYNDFKDGNWGSGIGNSLWALGSLIPGVGAVKGLIGGAKAGLKGTQMAASAARGARNAMPMKAHLGLAGAGMAAPMLDPAQPQQGGNAYNTPTYRPGNLTNYMARAMVNNGVPQ